MATIGRLSVKIDADSTGLTSGLRSAEGGVNSFSLKAGALVDKLKLIGPAAILAGGALGVAMVRNVANTADALGKLSTRTGVAVEDLSRLQYAASLSDVSTEQLSGGITRLSRNMSDAAAGTGEAGKAFEAMGISVANADGTLRAQRDVLNDVADRFATYEDGAQKSALAQQIFGRAGAQMITMLNGGSKALKEMADESDRLGNTIDTKTAKAAERFNDNITRLNTAVGGVSRQIAGPMIQALADMTDRMNEASKAGNGLLSLTDPISSGLAGIAKVMETIAVLGVNLAYVLKMTGNELGGLAAQSVAIASLDFKGASTIGELMRQDAKAAREEVDRLSASILALRKSGDISPIEGLDFSAESAKFMRQQKPPLVPPPAPVMTPTPTGGGASKAVGSIFDDGDPVQANAADAQDQADREAFAKRIEALREYVKTEEQITLERQEKQLEDMKLGRENGLLTEQEYMLAEQDMALKHMEELARIRGDGMKKINDISKMSWNEQLALTVGKLGEMTAAAATGSKAMFNINKAAAIADALLKAKASVTSAYKFGMDIGGPPMAAAFAGVAAAATAGQIAAIKSQSFGGGGSVASGGGTAATTAPTQSAASGGASQSITIQGVSSGDLFSGDAVRTLIDKLIDAQRNGARIVLA